jgi:hypothetical protein
MSDGSPSVLARMAQAARYVVSGVTPDTWFGPLQPLPPAAPPEVKGRQWDYPVGWNLNYVPRASERVGFDRLRALADGYDLLRLVIETRKDQMEALNWAILPREKSRGRRARVEQYAPQIAAVTRFLERPDRRHDWPQWLRAVLEEHFVIDAPALYRRRNRGGGLYALEILDGARIKVLLGADGRAPEPPSPAYQQVLKGIPAADYTSDELLYYPKNYRAHRAYGFSPVEQIVVRVETALGRVRSQLAYFTEGNIPDGFITGPEGWTMDQIRAMQEHWDALFAGNVAQRRRAWWVPAGARFQAVKNPPLMDEFDEWLARVVCYAFSVSPQPFVKQMNRATAQSAAEAAAAEGLAPTMAWTKRLLDRIIAEDFGSPDLEFAWDEDREFDPTKAATINEIYVRNGIKTIDEVRDDLGLDALGGAAATPLVATATGYVPVKGAGDEQDAPAGDAALGRFNPAQPRIPKPLR